MPVVSVTAVAAIAAIAVAITASSGAPVAVENISQHFNFAQIKDVLKERKVENGQLLLLPGESQSETNVSLLGSEKMKAVIQKLSSMADVVLLDTAPAQLLADAAMMARYVDSAAFR